jgi:hypothetical protein
MISWLKKNKAFFYNFNNSSGNALPLVLFFSAFGLIAVVSYLYFHYSYSRISFKEPASLQALFNARSGIYKGFMELSKGISKSDTLATINTLDSAFGKQDFGIDTTEISGEEKLTLDGGTVNYSLYANDTLGECEVSLDPVGGSCLLKSIGTYKKSKHTIEVLLGTKIPALPDTVLVLNNKFEWEGKEPKGVVVNREDTTKADNTWLQKLIDKYKTDLTATDSLNTILDPPLTIQANKDFKKIPRLVNGDLLIDGSFVPLSWKDTGAYIILGNFSLSNEIKIEGIKFIVAGEIILDGKVHMKNINLFSQTKIFIGGTSRFSGNAMALQSIAIYGTASVENKSTLLVAGISTSSAPIQHPHKSNNQDTQPNSGTKENKKIYAIEIGEKATVDGVLVALGERGDVKTHPDVKISGIMIAQKSVGHFGKMLGLICAGSVIDPDAPLPPLNSGSPTLPQKNVMPGDLAPLASIESYSLPFFLGKLTIISWKED